MTVGFFRPFRDLGLDIFRHRIVEDEVIGSRITSEVLKLINKERYARFT